MTTNRPQIVWQEMGNRVTNPTFRHPRLTIASLLLALGMVLAGTPAAEARDAPRRSGPLNFDDPRACGRETLKRRVDGRLETVAKAETCVYIFNYDPLEETNENRDYGIAWVQVRVEPRGAWCTKKVWSDLVVSSDTKILKRSPARGYKPRKSKMIEVKVTSNAQGAGGEQAVVREKTTIHPRSLRHTSFRFRGQRVFRQRWTGQRGRPLNLTSGAELSWKEEDPPDAITSGILYDFERRGRC